MSEITPIVRSPREPFADACNAANAWRGACIHLFAEGEMALAQTLKALALVPKGGTALKSSQMIAQNISAVAKLVGPGGAFAVEGEKVAAALAAIETHLPWRARLTHGVGKPYLNAQGEWLLSLRFFGSGKDKEEQKHFIGQSDAELFRKALSADVRRFIAALAEMCKAVAV